MLNSLFGGRLVLYHNLLDTNLYLTCLLHEENMKIQIASDLHLEFIENRDLLRNNPLQPQADVLILAGDTVPYIMQESIKEFYEKWYKDFAQVYSICGNHEFYRGECNWAYPSFEKEIFTNHIQLNNKAVYIGDYLFLFSTLWSDIPLDVRANIQAIMNDYRVINKRTLFKELTNLQIEDTVNYFYASRQFLESQLAAASNQKTVVVTHHSPLYDNLSGEYGQIPLKYSYGNDLSSLILGNPQIKYWIHGHCHFPDSRILGNTLILRNPLGYVAHNQQENFRRDLYLELT